MGRDGARAAPHPEGIDHRPGRSNPAWSLPPFSSARKVTSMKAILCSQYCQPDDLVLADVPDPVAGPGEAVGAIKAAALNFFDILMIQGKYQIKPPFPFSPAAEIAGVVESVGAGVTGLKPGYRVAASCGHNGAREKIALPAASIVRIPDNLDFDRAAGIIIIYGTALHALEDRASPKPGERGAGGDARRARRGRRHRACRLRARQVDGTEGNRLRLIG